MIKVDRGKVEISGNSLQISSEFSTLVYALLEMEVNSGIPEEIAKKVIRNAFETGLKSEKEIKKESDKIKNEMHMSAPEISKAIGDLLDSIFGGKPDDDN